MTVLDSAHQENSKTYPTCFDKALVEIFKVKDKPQSLKI